MSAKKIMTDDMARSPRLSKLKGLTFTGNLKMDVHGILNLLTIVVNNNL
jgi:hypothetical protein